MLARWMAVERWRIAKRPLPSLDRTELPARGVPPRAGASRIAAKWAGAPPLLILSLVLLGLVAGPSSAQVGVPTKSRIVRVYYPDLAAGNQVIVSFEASLLETDYAAGYHVLDASDSTIAILEAAGLQVEEDPFYQKKVEKIPNFPCYASVEETFAAAAAIASANPDLADWTDIGDSWQKTAGLGGYDIMVLVLTNETLSGDKPKLLVTCAIHAREYTTAQLCLDFAEDLVEGYGSDADATWLLDDHEIHLVLQANPDGRKQAEAGIYWRKNTNQNYCGPASLQRGADLNRNFPFAWNCCGGSSGWGCDPTFRGSFPNSEPEVAAVVDYGRTIFPDQRGPGSNDPAPADASGIFLDLHSYGELVLWPWGYTSAAAPNGSALQSLGRKLAFGNNYWPQQAIGLYPTDGTTDDFFYGELGVASIAFELGTAFFQSCSVYENTVRPANLPVLRYAAKIARAPYQLPSGPDVTSLSLSANTVLKGESVTLDASLDDARFSSANGFEPTQSIVAVEYSIDIPAWKGGAGVAMAPSDGNFNSVFEAAVVEIDTTSLSSGRHAIFVRGIDTSNQWGAPTAVFLTVQEPALVPALSLAARSLAALLLVAGGISVTRRWQPFRATQSGSPNSRSERGDRRFPLR